VTASGNISAVGNIAGGNITTAGLISATGNITGGNVNAAGLSLTGNVVSALNVTGNITGSNVVGVNILSIPFGAADPAGVNIGSLFYNQTSGKVKVWSGASWVLLN